VVEQDPTKNFLLWGNSCNKSPSEPNCSSVLWYGMKRDFNAWLASLGAAAPVKTLAELRAFNSAKSNRNAIKYGQVNLDNSDALDLEKDRAKWEADRKKDIELAATNGIDATLKAHKLDALLFPGASGAGIAAKPGYPTVIVPFALVTPQPPQNAPYPDGFTPAPAPYGVSFTGTACSEPRLIELAYAFEQATKRRVPPPSTP
jgi:amidase